MTDTLKQLREKLPRGYCFVVAHITRANWLKVKRFVNNGLYDTNIDTHHILVAACLRVVFMMEHFDHKQAKAFLPKNYIKPLQDAMRKRNLRVISSTNICDVVNGRSRYVMTIYIITLYLKQLKNADSN